jgi:hypothetical protein
MSEGRIIALVRVSYWMGAIFDALVIVPMLFPNVASTVLGIPNFNPGNDYKYSMYIAAALMLGWTTLLIWADRKPIERRGVLFLTILPVLIGLVISGIYAVSSNFIPMDKMLPTWMMQGFFILLYGFSYLNANKLAEKNYGKTKK